MTKLVSIIMPVYNAEKFVGQAIQSVIAQTYPHWELIIINDGSTDDSVREISQFHDRRILALHQKNSGVSSARNRGLARMNGDYFCFLDADDALTPDSIEVRLRLFDDGIGFVDGAVEVFDADMRHKERQWTPQASGNVLSRLFRLSDECFFGLTWLVKRQPNTMYRFDESLSHCEDLLFFMSIAHTGSYIFTPESVLCYRRNPNSAMHNLEGLAQGYTLLRRRLHSLFANKLSLCDKLVYDYKVRKIIFLNYLWMAKFRTAMCYLLNGRL